MQIFNDKKKRIGTLSGFKDREITTTLDSGDKELSFSYPAAGALVDLLKEEYYIHTKTDEYVIKAVEKGEQFNKYTAVLNVEELEGTAFPYGLNHRSRQSRHVLSLHLRVRDGMSEYVPSQRKEPSTSRRVSPHGMSCKSASQHTAASASSIH